MKFFKFLSNKKSILILFLIFIGFNIYFLIQFQELKVIAGQEVQILDLRFGYSFEDVNIFFNQLGKEGLLLYKKISFADMFYPISYGLLLMSLLSFLAKGNRKLYCLSLLPLAAVIIDFFENFKILEMMSLFPNLQEALVSNSSLLTQIKWSIVVLCIIYIIILLLNFKRPRKHTGPFFKNNTMLTFYLISIL